MSTASPTDQADVPPRPALQRVRADHAAALLAFERENRAYFAASIPDRGDDYFADFDARHRELLAAQADGVDLFHVLVEPDGRIVGRVNLFGVHGGSADLGYRIAESAAGQGLATWAVRRICVLAATDYGLTELRAKATIANVASRVVLTKVGFEQDGEVELSSGPGLTYHLKLPIA
jgi:ribosomal-protein-alanine N-acetyltransferase